MADPWTLLLTGDFISALLSVFTNVMGFWFYALMLFAFEILVYLKTENVTMVVITSIIITIAMSALIPAQAASFAYIAVALIIATILWKAFH